MIRDTPLLQKYIHACQKHIMDVPVLQLAKIMVYHSNVYLCSNSTLIAASFCVNLEPAASTLKEIENGLREVTDYNLISAKPN